MWLRACQAKEKKGEGEKEEGEGREMVQHSAEKGDEISKLRLRFSSFSLSPMSFGQEAKHRAP